MKSQGEIRDLARLLAHVKLQRLSEHFRFASAMEGEIMLLKQEGWTQEDINKVAEEFTRLSNLVINL